MNRTLIIMLCCFLAAFQGILLYHIEVLETLVFGNVSVEALKQYQEYIVPFVVLIKISILGNISSGLFFGIDRSGVKDGLKIKKFILVGVPAALNCLALLAVFRLTFAI